MPLRLKRVPLWGISLAASEAGLAEDVQALSAVQRVDGFPDCVIEGVRGLSEATQGAYGGTVTALDLAGHPAGWPRRAGRFRMICVFVSP